MSGGPTGGWLWEVTLTTQQTLTTIVVSDHEADDDTLRELALAKADRHEAIWETVYSETSTRPL
jgi:hypothetical protein